jgi:hypothetical protein
MNDHLLWTPPDEAECDECREPFTMMAQTGETLDGTPLVTLLCARHYEEFAARYRPPSP